MKTLFILLILAIFANALKYELRVKSMANLCHVGQSGVLSDGTVLQESDRENVQIKCEICKTRNNNINELTDCSRVYKTRIAREFGHTGDFNPEMTVQIEGNGGADGVISCMVVDWYLIVDENMGMFRIPTTTMDDLQYHDYTVKYCKDANCRGPNHYYSNGREQGTITAKLSEVAA